MTRQEAAQTVTNLKATGVFTRVWDDAPEPWVDFTVYARIENSRSGNNNMTVYHQPLTEAEAKKAAKQAKAKAKTTDARTFGNFRADRENQR
jgi:hypothetical protein